MRALGIDIGGTSVKAEILGGSAARSARYDARDRDALVRAIAEAAAGVGDAKGFAIGVCAPGALDEATGVVTASVNVPALVGIAPAELVQASLGTRAARVTTDAHAAAYDVWASRELQGRLLAVSLGTGVGACVLDEGEVLRVSGTSSGHLGQIDVSLDADPPIAADGSAGTMEAYLGARALEARFGSAMSDPDWSLDANDPVLRALAKGLRIAHAIYRPMHIVLLGGVGLRLKSSLPALRRIVEDRLTSLVRPGWTLSCGEDEFHAARGAARLALA